MVKGDPATIASKIMQTVKHRIDQIGRFNGIGISVGIDSSATYENGKSVSEVAKYVEYGTRKMAPRPFMRVAETENMSEWSRNIFSGIVESLKSGSADKLEYAGRRMVEDVRSSIAEFGIGKTGKLYKSIVYGVGRK